MKFAIYIYDSGTKYYNNDIIQLLDLIKSYPTNQFKISLITTNKYIEIDGDIFDKINIITRNEILNKPRLLNYCIIDAFNDLRKPNNDLLIIIRDGIKLVDKWIDEITKSNNNFLIQNGFGDEFLAIKPELIKEIGLFDERLLLYYDVDFYIRTLLYTHECIIDDKLNNIVTAPLKLIQDRSTIVDVRHPQIELDSANLFKLKWMYSQNNVYNNILNITKIPESFKYYYQFEQHINKKIYQNNQIIKNLLYEKYINIERTLNDGIYYIINLKSSKYLTSFEHSPHNCKSMGMSEKHTEFYIYRNLDKYSIKLNLDIKNQNGTNGWHLYTVPKSNTLFGAGNGEKWATFDIIKKDKFYLIKSVHNEKNKNNRLGRYLYVEYDKIYSDGDSNMEECLWIII